MTDEQKRILELTTAIGIALGALEMIQLRQYEFNVDGLELIIKQLRATVEKNIYG